MRVQQMVEAVQQMEAVQTAPAAVEQVLAKQAEGTPNATIYVDGIRFAESLQQAGISREDLTWIFHPIRFETRKPLLSRGFRHFWDPELIL